MSATAWTGSRPQTHTYIRVSDSPSAWILIPCSNPTDVGSCNFVSGNKYCSNHGHGDDTKGAWKISGRGSRESCLKLCEETVGCHGGYYRGNGDTCYLYAPGKSADAECASPKLDGDESTFAFDCDSGAGTSIRVVDHDGMIACARVCMSLLLEGISP